MAATATVERFLQAFARSGLLSSATAREAAESAPDGARTDAKLLAEHFVRLGKLSHFQARKLLDGTAAGLVLGPYHIVMPIGRGGMGTVYLARDTQTPRLLALKVLPPKKARESERLVARFRREMDLSQHVGHPNLTQTYDVGEAQGVNYIAMEYIAGESLYRLVATGGPLPIGRAAKLFAQAAAGLSSAHAAGLIHRDMKPSNIMVTPRDQVKVLDLGLALMADEDNVEIEVVGGKGYVLGTMDYIAPEQTEDSANVDARCDLYSLGCTLYFALTGQPPFPGGDARSKIRRHRRDVPTPLQEMNPLVPADFAAAVHPLLAKDPKDRPESAAAVRKLLLPFADPEPPPYIAPMPAGIDPTQLVAALETERPENQVGWDWMPAVSLAKTAGRDSNRIDPRWWLLIGTIAVLAASLLVALLIKAVRG